jgi:hypothetical protein
MSQLSSGYSHTLASPSYIQHAHPAYAPTRNPSMQATPFLTAPPQWTSDGSTQGQEQNYYLGAAAYSRPTQASQRQPYTSPTNPILAGTFSLADDPYSHVPPYLAHANLTASGVAPNFGAAPGGSNMTVGGTSTVDELALFNQHVRPSRTDRTNRGQGSKPYQRPTPVARKTRPITYEGNLVRLQQRCWGQGTDEGAIGLLGKVFANEVSLGALTRLLTDAEVETKEFGVETGRVYIAFLETVNEEEGVEPRYVCRLCHSERTWKHHKDALRHLRRDHFGLADVCDQWYVFGRSWMFCEH